MHSSRHDPQERLADVDPGDRLTVDWGGRHHYRVVRRVEGIDTARLPMRLVAKGGDHLLAVVTCGDFSWRTETWRTRTIVWAMPLE